MVHAMAHANAVPIAREEAHPKPVPKRLPIYKAGGQHDPVFQSLKRKEAPIAAEVAAMDLATLLRHPSLSANAKTSVSLDFPIGQTCDPTARCAHFCYAAVPRAATTWRKSLRKRLRNMRYFTLVSTEEAVERLTKEFAQARRRWAPRARLDYLRVCGTGDLFPALVPVLNGFAAANPDVRVWIVSRQFELAGKIEALPNIFLQLSLDDTTPTALEEAARRLVAKHPRAYLSFLRTTPDDDTRGAAIVFNEKRTDHLPYHPKTDCPVDAGRLPLDNIRGVGGTACAKCRKCFSERTVERQRELLGART
jgi:hypothetical protein